MPCYVLLPPSPPNVLILNSVYYSPHIPDHPDSPDSPDSPESPDSQESHDSPDSPNSCFSHFIIFNISYIFWLCIFFAILYFITFQICEISCFVKSYNFIIYNWITLSFVLFNIVWSFTFCDILHFNWINESQYWDPGLIKEKITL